MYYVYWIHLLEHTDILSEGYVGISQDTVRRLIEHKSYKKNAHLTNAIKKYGDKIIMEVVLMASKERCIEHEKVYRPLANIGWNIAPGGGIPPSPLGRKVLNRKSPVGKLPHTEETKQRISNTLKGHKKTPEMIAKRSASRTGVKRKPFSIETKEKMRIAALNRRT